MPKYLESQTLAMHAPGLDFLKSDTNKLTTNYDLKSIQKV